MAANNCRSLKNVIIKNIHDYVNQVKNIYICSFSVGKAYIIKLFQTISEISSDDYLTEREFKDALILISLTYSLSSCSLFLNQLLVSDLEKPAHTTGIAPSNIIRRLSIDILYLRVSTILQQQLDKVHILGKDRVHEGGGTETVHSVHIRPRLQQLLGHL